MSKRKSAEANGQSVDYFVLAKPTRRGLELAKPASPKALPYAARRARALQLQRLRGLPWQLYLLEDAGDGDYRAWRANADGPQLELVPEEAVELTLEQAHAVAASIANQDRWSGPVSPGEAALLPQRWETERPQTTK